MSVLAAWKSGDALGAVMGHAVDLADIDPRNGGAATRATLVEQGDWPKSYGLASTPSGGTHEFIAPLGVGSLDGLRDGLDVKGGKTDGSSRGFAFIAPTVKVSKTTGEIVAYRWVDVPDLDGVERDTSGAGLAGMILDASPSRRRSPGNGNDQSWGSLQGTPPQDWRSQGTIPVGQRHTALVSLAGHLRRAGFSLDVARDLLKSRWEACEQPSEDPMPWVEVEQLLEDVFTRYQPHVSTLDESAHEDTYERDVARAKYRLQVREAGKRAFLAGHVADQDDSHLYLSLADLENLPVPEALIHGVLHRHSYVILRGRDATSKTFLALDWALHLATGTDWNGLKVQQAKVLYLVGEGVHGFPSRVSAWQHYNDAKLDGSMIALRQGVVNLYRGGPELERLIERISEGRYELVVIDTLNKASAGADANSSTMNLVLENIERIKRATADGSVLVIAHTDKGDNDTRGSSGIEDDADSVFHAVRTKREDTVKVTNTKMKDGLEGASYTLRAETSLSSLVLVAADADDDHPEQPKSGHLILQSIRKTPGITATELLAELDDTKRGSERVAKATLYPRLKEMEQSGVIVKKGKHLWVAES